MNGVYLNIDILMDEADGQVWVDDAGGQLWIVSARGQLWMDDAGGQLWIYSGVSGYKSREAIIVYIEII